MLDNKPPSQADSKRATKAAGNPAGQATVGAVFGRYQIVRELGRGGMGVVYMALDPSLKRHVALKIVNQAFVSDREKKRFENETYVMAKLSHPNITKIFDVGEEQGRHFFTMELVAGIGINRLLEESIPQPRLLQIMVKVAQAVHHAHQQGIIHRDLKPSNVMVLRDDEPKVMDFGLAKEIAGNQQLTQSQDAIGTPYYMSPEQAGRRGRDIDARSDVFALGVMLYQIVTGKLPFTGDTPLNVMYQIMFDEPLSPSRVNPGITQDLEAICLKAIEKEKNRRYKSAAAFADDLSRYLAGQPIEAKPVTRWSRLGKWVRRHRVTSVVVALATMLLVTGATVSFLRERNLRQLAESQRIEAEKQKQEAERLRQLAETKTVEARLSLAESELVLAKNDILAQDYFQVYARCQHIRTLLQDAGRQDVACPVGLVNKRQFLEKTVDNIEAYLLSFNPHRHKRLLVAGNFRDLYEQDSSADVNSPPQQLTTLQGLPAMFPDFQQVSLQFAEQGVVHFAPISPSWDYLVYWRHEKSEQAVLWDIGKKMAIADLPMRPTRAVAFAANRVAIGDAFGNILVYEIDSGRRRTVQIEVPPDKKDVEYTRVRSLRFSHDGKWLFSAMSENIVLWELPAMTIALKRNYGGVKAVCAFSGNDKRMAIGGLDKEYGLSTYVFYLEDLKKSPTKFAGRAKAMCFGAEDKTIVVGDNRDIRIYPVEDNALEIPITLLAAHQGEIYDLAVSKNGDFLISVGQDGKLTVWSAFNYQRICQFQLANGRGYLSLACHPTQNSVGVWGSEGFGVCSWQNGSHRQLDLLQRTPNPKEDLRAVVKIFCRSNFGRSEGSAAVGMTMSRDASLVAYHVLWPLHLWQVKQDELHFLASRKQDVRRLAFSHDDALLLCVWWEEMIVWDIARQKMCLQEKIRPELSYQTCWLPGTRQLVSVQLQNRQTRINIYDIKDMCAKFNKRIDLACEYSLDYSSLTFDRSGTRVAIDQHDTIHIFPLNGQYQQPVVLKGLPTDEKVMSFVEDRFLAIGHNEGDFWIFDWQQADKRPLVHVKFADPIRRMWYDPERQLYWIFTGTRLFIYPHVTDPSLRDVVGRIYPLPAFSGYPLLGCDIGVEFHHIALLLLSYKILLFDLFRCPPKQE